MKIPGMDILHLLIITLILTVILEWLEIPILEHKTRIPGMNSVKLPSKCCELDWKKESIKAGYEPNFTRTSLKIKGNWTISLPQPYKMNKMEISCLNNRDKIENFEICAETLDRLSEIFKKLKQSILKRCFSKESTENIEFYKSNKNLDETSADQKWYFIGSSGKLICLVIGQWVLPLVCNFQTLSGGMTPHLNLAWKFSYFQTYPVADGYIIDLKKHFSFTINTLCMGDLEVKEIDKDKFKLDGPGMAISILSPSVEAPPRQLSNEDMLVAPITPRPSKSMFMTILLYVSYGLILISTCILLLTIFPGLKRNYTNAPSANWGLIVLFLCSTLCLCVFSLVQVVS